MEPPGTNSSSAQLPDTALVDQPLLDFVRERSLLDDIVEGRAPIRSHVSYYLPYD